MLKTLKRLGVSFFIAVFILNIAMLPTADHNLSQVEASTTGKVAFNNLHIRTTKSTKAKCIKIVNKGTKIELLSTGSKWVKVRVNGKIGYTQGKYISTAYGTASKPYANAVSGTVSANKLAIRTSKSTNASRLLVVKKGDKVQVLTTNSKWVKVKVNGVTGYAQGKYISTSNGGNASNTGSKGQSVISYALRFVGNPYRWGGTSLTHGADCSGFVMSVYRHFGISLPHSSSALRHVGTAVHGLSNAKPGDIICYSGHVALYIGNGKIVHASNRKDGIKISPRANYRRIVAIRRIFNRVGGK